MIDNETIFHPRSPDNPELPGFAGHEERTYENTPAETRFFLEASDKFGFTDKERANFGNYLHFLNLKPEDFIGKKTVDIGSSDGCFKSALEKFLQQELDIVNFDRRKLFNIDVRGEAENLPFLNESFDITLAAFSVPVMQSSYGESTTIPGTMDELFRVTKTDGGVIKVVPALVGGKFPRTEMNEEVLSWLKTIYKNNPQMTANIIDFAETDDEQVIVKTISLLELHKRHG